MTLAQTLLWPFTLPYGAAMHLRTRAYQTGLLKQKRLNGIVISVGNLTTGGTGKTPMVLCIAERLAAEGKKVGILTRGYRGETRIASADAGGEETQREVSSSDEVQLLHERLGDRVAIGVGASRFTRGTDLAKQGVEWFVLDDGFQHLALARDVNILLIDATNPFGGGYLLPAGRLREPRTALARADIIVVTRSEYTPAVEAAIRHYSTAPIFHARAKLDSIISVDPNRSSDVAAARLNNLNGAGVFAFCGIGNPSAFIQDLRTWGYTVSGSKFFPDHHHFTQQDIQNIESAAAAVGATALICTEKDKFNLTGVRWKSENVWYCQISLQITREDDFWRAILAKLETGGAGAR